MSNSTPQIIPANAAADRFFDAVQAELDGRCDPLDRADLVAWLEQHPEALSDFADLVAAHAALQSLVADSNSESVAAGSSTERRGLIPWRPWVGLAAAAALLLFVFLYDGNDPQQLEDQPAAVRVLSVRQASSEVLSSYQPSEQLAVEGAVILSVETTTKRVVKHSRHQS